MAFTSEQLAALEEAIAQGVTTVAYNGKTVTYRNLADMIKLRDMMRKELGQVSSGSTTILTKFGKGLG